MLGFQQQDSQLTLAEGLAEYFAANAPRFNGRHFTSPAAEFFRCHDTAHVVFGCDISLADELVVKISSVFGTSAGLGVMRGYALPESKEIYEELTLSLIVATAIQAIVLVPLTIWRCLRMSKRWPWDDFDNYLDMPLSQLRQELGIRVPRR